MGVVLHTSGRHELTLTCNCRSGPLAMCPMLMTSWRKMCTCTASLKVACPDLSPENPRKSVSSCIVLIWVPKAFNQQCLYIYVHPLSSL